MGTSRHGPEFKPVSREDKVDEWANAIQAKLRLRGGGEIPAAEAIEYADRFWRHMQGRSIPIKDIMNADSKFAVEWILSREKDLVLFVGKSSEEDTGEYKVKP
jgi:hypothetical protein